MLDKYLAIKQSDEFKNSLMDRLMTLVHDFQQASGYSDIFIPMMKKLSRSYANYSARLEAANDKFLAKYPDAARL